MHLLISPHFPDRAVGNISCSPEIQFGGMGQTQTLSCGGELRNISGLFFFFFFKFTFSLLVHPEIPTARFTN